MRPAPRRAAVALTAFGVALLSALPHLVGGVSRVFLNLDDPEYVSQNPRVLDGLSVSGARWALTAFHSANWHPLTWLSHMLDVSLFGPDPVWHHAMSIALHAAAAALLFVALRRMTGALWPAALVAALFGAHPLRVESVAWVAERKDVLSGLCFALLLLAYERHARRPAPARLLAALACLALGLAAKPMLVTAPLVLLLLDFWPLGRGRRTSPSDGPGRWLVPPGPLLLEKLPFAALAGVSAVLTVRAQQAFEALATTEAIPVGARVANALVAVPTYLAKTLWPLSLAVYYPYPASGHPWWKIAGAALLLAAVTLAVCARPRREPALAVGWFWFLGMLVPVLGFVQVGRQALADRYTYLPHVGLFLLAVFALRGCARGRLKPWLAGAAAVVLALLVAAGARQAAYWRDGVTLFTRTLALTADNWVIRTDLGVLLAEQGRDEEAAAQYREALRVKPGFAKARNNLGVVLMKLGRPEEAIAQYREALRLRPDLVNCRLNLANALAAAQRPAEAVVQYQEVLRTRPDSLEARFNLGNALAALGRFDEAGARFRESLAREPNLVQARINLGNVETALGRPREAAAAYRDALRLTPDSVEAHFNLANVLLRQERFAEAAPHYREALRLRPGLPGAERGLAAALAGAGR